ARVRAEAPVTGSGQAQETPAGRQGAAVEAGGGPGARPGGPGRPGQPGLGTARAPGGPGAGAPGGPGRPGGPSGPAGPAEMLGDTRFEAAQAAMDSGDLDAAATALEQVLADTPEHPVAKAWLAQVDLIRRVNSYDRAKVVR